MKILKFIAYFMLFGIFCTIITTPPYNFIFIVVCVLVGYWLLKNNKIKLKKPDTSKESNSEQLPSNKPVSNKSYRKKSIPKEFNYGKKASKLPKNYCVLDLETTGLSPRNNEIIEIGILKIKNNKIVDSYNSLVKPNKPITPGVTKINHITNAMVESSPSFNEIKEDVITFIGDNVIVAHNATFDLNFLVNSLKSSIQNRYLDTLQLSRKYYPDLPNHKLETLVNELNLIQNSHRALDDCKSTYELFEKIKEIA